MNSKSSGKGLEGFLMGKGFYIVLFLCAAVIGLSAWMMTAGNETMEERDTNLGTRVETVLVTPDVQAPSSRRSRNRPRPSGRRKRSCRT